jgi:hypothetical protein
MLFVPALALVFALAVEQKIRVEYPIETERVGAYNRWNVERSGALLPPPGPVTAWESLPQHVYALKL